MKRLVVLLGTILLTVLCGGVLSLDEKVSTIPLFVWSSKSLFSMHNEQYLDTLTVQDLEDSLQALIFQSGSKNFIKTKGSPESVVLFIEPQLHTDQISRFGAAYSTSLNGGAFSSLKSIVESSSSSLVAPYVSTGTQFSLLDSALARIVRKLSKGNVVVIREEGSTLFSAISRNDDVQTLSVNDLKADTFSNGVPALIIVCLDFAEKANEFATHDALIKRINEAVSTASNGNFLAMYTGNAATSAVQWTFPQLHSARSPSFYMNYWDVQNTTNTTGNSTGPRTYLTGPILEAFMVLIALITMLFVGLCNLCKLQVPEQFETPKVQKQIM